MSFATEMKKPSRPTPWWKLGVHQELAKLVERGRLKPCRAIDLGCGSGKNTVFLAKFGFDVTGVDNAEGAIELVRKRTRAAGVSANLVLDDFPDLKNVQGTYDLLVDLGTLADLVPKDREVYVQNLLPLTRTGSQFLLYCYEWTLYWWERLVIRFLSRFGYGGLTLEPGDVQCLLGPYFRIQKVGGESNRSNYPRGYAVYLMTRK